MVDTTVMVINNNHCQFHLLVYLVCHHNKISLITLPKPWISSKKHSLVLILLNRDRFVDMYLYLWTFTPVYQWGSTVINEGQLLSTRVNCYQWGFFLPFFFTQLKWYLWNYQWLVIFTIDHGLTDRGRTRIFNLQVHCNEFIYRSIFCSSIVVL